MTTERSRVVLLGLPRMQREIVVELLEPWCELVEPPGAAELDASAVVPAEGCADIVVASLSDDLGGLSRLASAVPGMRVLLLVQGGQLLLELLGELSPEVLVAAVRGAGAGGAPPPDPE